jgi:hypothetical protein
VARLVLKPGAVRDFATLQARKDVRSTTIAVNRQARQNAPGGSYSTGRLKKSINWSVQTSGWNVRGRSGSDLSYAIFPERGASAHEIRPVGKPFLRFYWRRVGRWVRLSEVNHPGQAAQNYMTRALLDIAPQRGYRVVIY